MLLQDTNTWKTKAEHLDQRSSSLLDQLSDAKVEAAEKINKLQDSLDQTVRVVRLPSKF